MFANIYQRVVEGSPVGPPVPGGWWETREAADRVAKLNENPGFKRTLCLDAPEGRPLPCLG